MKTIEFLLKHANAAALIAALRCMGTSPERRAEAAGALARLKEMDAVETLVCAAQADPEESVREAALSALEAWLGREAQLAIRAYPMNADEKAAWMVSAADEDTVLDVLRERRDPVSADLLQRVAEPWEMSSRETIGENDLFKSSPKPSAAGLVSILRSLVAPADARAEAAVKMGQLYLFETTENLVRAHLEDAEPHVQASARQALDLLYGSRAEMVIDSYREAFPYEDAWLIQPGVGEENDEYAGVWPGEDVPSAEFYETDELRRLEKELNTDADDFDGLYLLIKGHAPLPMRSKAVELLAYSSNVHAVTLLLHLAVAEDDPLQPVARKVLADQFPDDYRQMLLDFMGQDEEDEVEEPDSDDPAETGEDDEYYRDEAPGEEKGHQIIPWLIGAFLFVGALALLAFLLAG